MTSFDEKKKTKIKLLSRALLKTTFARDTTNKKRETRNFGENIYRTHI